MVASSLPSPTWKRLVSLSLVSTLAAGVTSCGGGSRSPTAATTFDATAALDEILGILQVQSAYKNKVDWPSVRSSVHALGDGAHSESLLDPAIREAFRLLGDNHSQYYHPNNGQVVLSPLAQGCISADVGPLSVPANVGYVSVPSTAQVSGIAYALALQSAIKSSDRPDLVGWIVDVRGNTGGSFYEMLAGVGPVLGDGAAGQFISADGATSVVAYTAGVASIDGIAQMTVTNPYALVRPNPRVAVLINNKIGSAGEAVVASFIGRPNTRQFGISTCGYSTGISGFRLSSGALLNLAVGFMADRTGKQYGGGPIPPDETITDPVLLLARAVAFLNGQ